MNRIVNYLFGALPQNAISSIVGKFASSSLSEPLIKPFAQKYDINVQEAAKPLDDYHTLTDFFTRHLKSDARPVDNEDLSIVSPVDGTIAQFGNIVEGHAIQAKGITYSIEDLIGSEKAKAFDGGKFMTIYLSPSDYHRIHMPVTGTLKGYEYIPGRLFPVNRIGVNHVNGLFTKNERLTTYFTSAEKEMALVKVGAFIVGSIKLSYQENVHHLHRGQAYKWAIPSGLTRNKSEEVGFFEFGSTVILLFEENAVGFAETLKNGDKLQMGQRIGVLL